MRIINTLFGSLALSVCVHATAQAQDVEQTLARVTNAYNVETLDLAETIRLESDYRLPFESHDYSVDFHDLAHQKFQIILDYHNQRGSHEFVTDIAGTRYHGRHLLLDGTETFISYGPDTYTDSVESEFFTRFGGTFRASDVLLAHWLTRVDREVSHVREAIWLGHPHDVIEVDYPSSPPLHVFVRKSDGAITKMERRVSDEQSVFYTFRNHQTQDGVLIAREHSLFLGDRSIYFGFNRTLTLNDPADRAAFELDPYLEPEPQRTDQTDMTVRLVGGSESAADAVYQVCQGEGCTTFMNQDGNVLGYGMSSGFADRLVAYRAQSGTNDDLRFVIAADHHDEDISGASEAAELGATLLVSDQTARKFQSLSAEYDVEIISTPRKVGDVMLYSVSTDHTMSALIAFHETHGLLMQTGHYYSSFVDGPSYARRTAVSLYESLPVGIQDKAVAILSGQDLKPEIWSDFVAAVEAYEPIRCHHNRSICADVSMR